MSDWNLDDIEGLPTDPAELRNWVGRLRALFRTWADMKAGGKPEEAFAKAAGVMVEIRAMLSMPSAEEEIAALKATASETEVVGGEPVKKVTGPLTVDAVRAAKFTRISEKGGVIVSRSNASGRLTMHKDGDRYTFHVDEGKLGEWEFGTVGEAVEKINTMPKESK